MMPVKTLIEFILYIVPGFIAREVYDSIFPGKEKGQFSQVGWSVFYGIIIFYSIKYFDINYFNCLLFSNNTDNPNPKFVLALFIGGICLGLLIAGVNKLREILAYKCGFSFLAPDPLSIWAKLLQPINKSYWVVVYLDDGATYLGWISDFTFNPNTESQDFLLKDAKRVDDDLKEKYLVDGLGVYLNTKNVKRIEFLKGQKKREQP